MDQSPNCPNKTYIFSIIFVKKKKVSKQILCYLKVAKLISFKLN